MSSSIIQALLAFGAVVAAIPLALALIRRSRNLGAGRRRIIQLAGGLSLGPRERIAVVEVGGRWLVVGVTGASINLLATLDEPPADLAARGSPAPADGVFARLLAQASARAGR
ncbi:MAG: flagellar biosynthetic protein FliO [Burkholderiaceae bacterium]